MKMHLNCCYYCRREYFISHRNVKSHQLAGIWLGVDWDDKTRGRHDGSHNGKHYFDATYSTSGSFVRPIKVDVGRPFLEAVKERYGTFDLDIYGHSIGSKVIEVVGMEKLAKKQRYSLPVLR